MKLLTVLLILTVHFSCDNTAISTVQTDSNQENWTIASSVTSHHTYKESGLLDTTFRTTFIYVNGNLQDSIQSMICRIYKDNQLNKEQEFILSGLDKPMLSNERIRNYNQKGKLLSDIIVLNKIVLNKTLNEYNLTGQKIRSITIFQKAPELTTHNNIDSAIAYHNDKNRMAYDTLIYFYQYDTKGNEIQTLVTDSKRNTQKTSVTSYSGNNKVFSYDLSAQGDTLATYSFTNDGMLSKEVVDMKHIIVDTIWTNKGKEVKVIGQIGNAKHKVLTSYNKKGDEIESVSYK